MDNDKIKGMNLITSCVLLCRHQDSEEIKKYKRLNIMMFDLKLALESTNQDLLLSTCMEIYNYIKENNHLDLELSKNFLNTFARMGLCLIDLKCIVLPKEKDEYSTKAIKENCKFLKNIWNIQLKADNAWENN